MTYLIGLILALTLVSLVTRPRRRRVRRAAHWLWGHPATVGWFVVSGYAWHRLGFNQALVVAVGYTVAVVAGRFWWQRTQSGQAVRQRLDELRGRPPKTPVPTALYRLYSVDRELLYIGISSDPARRFAQHAATQPWWDQVDHAWTRIVWFDDQAQARAAEAAAIRAELPAHNSVHNRRNPIRVARSAQRYAPTWPTHE